MAFGALLSNLTDVELFRMMHQAGPEVSDEILDNINVLDETQATAASEALFARVNVMHNNIMSDMPGWRTPGGHGATTRSRSARRAPFIALSALIQCCFVSIAVKHHA
jgi:hypothetical protein